MIGCGKPDYVERFRVVPEFYDDWNVGGECGTCYAFLFILVYVKDRIEPLKVLFHCEEEDFADREQKSIAEDRLLYRLNEYLADPPNDDTVDEIWGYIAEELNKNEG